MKQDVIKELLLRHNFVNLEPANSPVLKDRKLNFGFTFDVLIEGVKTKLLIGFNERFPISLPQYFVVDNDKFEFIPHVEDDGRICYYKDDYLFIDSDRISDILIETFQLVESVLIKGLKKENWIDFTTEFEAYWSRMKKNEVAFFNGQIEREATEVKVGIKGSVKLFVTGRNEYLQSTNRFFDMADGGFTFHNGIYIPLDGTKIIVPPRYNSQLSMDYIKNLITANANPKIVAQTYKLAKRESKAEEYILFSIIRNDNIPSVFGIKFSGMERSIHPLLSTNFSGKITPVTITRIDKEYLFKRGSNGNKYDKKGLIIGAGSVGGFIAEDLVRSGFFNLAIVDGDCISTENCYRHVVGFSSIGTNKAVAIKKYLEKKFPHCNIKAIDSNIEDLLNQRDFRIENYEFIIIATGNVTVNIYLNKWVRTKGLRIPFFYAWNDPYGIGGHCLFTNMNKSACYECLYSNEEKSNSASFAASHQTKSFLKSASGCGTFFTPYGATDSIQTSLLTTRKIVEVLSGNESQSSIHSWKGEPSVFIDEGYKLSDRYNMSDIELYEKKCAFVNLQCKVCR